MSRQAADVLDGISDAFAALDQGWRYTYVNRRAADLLGSCKEGLIGKSFWETTSFKEGSEVYSECHRSMAEQVPAQCVSYEHTTGRWYEHRLLPSEQGLSVYWSDVTERKRAGLEREITVEFLRLVNEATGTAELVKSAATFFHKHSGCEALGIRLRDGDDYPYYEARGFPQQFILLENQLCRRDAAGEVVRDAGGNPSLECMCGNVICGRIDPRMPFFTSGGSFWTNSTTALLASTTEEDRKARTRNRCNGQGYESVALVPLVAGSRPLGVLQLNDQRKGMFSPEVISLWERLGGHLAVALARAQNAEQLSIEKERLAVTLRSIGDAVIATDERSRITLLNTAAEELTGWNAGDAIGRSLHEVFRAIDEGTREPAADLLREMSRGSARRSAGPWALLSRDGTERPIHDSGAPIRDACGHVSGAVLVFRDRTEERRADEALRESEARYRELFQNMLDGFAYCRMLFDADGRPIDFVYLNVNGSFGRLTGLRDVVGKKVTEVIPGIRESQPELLEIYGRVAKTGRPEKFEVDFRPLSLWLSISVYSPHPDHFVAIFDNITERKQAEEALRAELALRDQLTKIAASVPGVIASFRLRPDGSACMPFTTPAVEDLFGVSQEALARDISAWSANIHPEDADRLDSGIQEAARHLSRWHATYRYLHPIRGLRWIESWSMPSREPDGSIVWHGYLTDVTGRKRAEEEREESVRRLRLHVQSTPVAMIEWDEELRVVSWNPAAEALFGWSAGEARGRHASFLVPESALAQVSGVMRQLLHRDGGRSNVNENLTKDGRTIICDWRNTSLVSSTGKVIGVASMALDVTERKRSERALRDSEQRFRATFEQAAVGMAEVDVRSGRFVRVNDKLCEIVGYPRDELLARGWRDITHPDDLTQDGESYARMLEGHRSYSRQKRYVRKDGVPVWANVTVSPMWPFGEEPTSHVSVVQDITARKRAEEALVKSEERFRVLIEKASDILVVFDRDMRVRFWSPSGTEQLGWTAEEALDREVFAFIHPDDQQRSKEVFEDLIASPGGSVRLVQRQLHKDGSSRLVEIIARNLLLDPAVGGLVANLRDITEQQRLTEQFQQAQKLESIGRLAGGIAHDFNNLLTVILSCSNALREDLQEGETPDPEDAEQIHAAGERARDLTRQLLAFARKQVIAPVPIDLNTVVQGCQEMLRRLLGEDLDLKVDLQSEPWLMSGDRGQLEQVILNLAVNARDAMVRGGTLTIETRNVSLTDEEAKRDPERQPGDWVRLVVRDTGAGMTPEVRAHLFEPFFTTKEVGKGTGLGLATVYGIVRQAGGHVHVRSEMDQGSSFEICFPRRQAVAPPVRKMAPVISRGMETILVVEDDAQVRTVIARALRSAGYQLLVAGSGAEALELFATDKEPVHLVITDVVMPGLDGKELITELGRRRTGLRVLYVSGYTQDVMSHHGLLDSGIDLLPKPFTTSALLAKVRAVLDADHGVE